MIFSFKTIVASLMVAIAIVQKAEAHYPYAHVVDSTPYDITGTVEYRACSNDSYTATPSIPWTGTSRGLCLITGVTATMVKSGGNRVDCEPYTSSGTSYSQFSVLYDASNGSCRVTRIVNRRALRGGKN